MSEFSENRRIFAETLERVASQLRDAKNSPQMAKLLREMVEELQCLGAL